MGCIRAETRRIGGDVIISTEQQGGNLQFHTKQLEGDIIILTERQGGDIQCTASQIGGNIRINTSLVCSIDPSKKVLKIEPKFIWLTESNNYTEIVNVLSNTDWAVK